MKKLALIATIFSVFLLVQCKKEYNLDAPGNKVEGLNGNWELYNVVQVDEIDLAKNERNISTLYVGDGTVEVMNITFKSSDKTFEVILGDKGKNYLPGSGTWAFDNDTFPLYLYLTDEEGAVTTLTLQGPTRPQDQQLKFSFKRSCFIEEENKDYVGYRYEFNRK